MKDELTTQDVKMLYLYRDIAPGIERIISLVQNNQDFFFSRLGASCIELAANKLELLVEEHNASRKLAAQQITAPDRLRSTRSSGG